MFVPIFASIWHDKLLDLYTYFRIIVGPLNELSLFQILNSLLVVSFVTIQCALLSCRYSFHSIVIHSSSLVDKVSLGWGLNRVWTIHFCHYISIFSTLICSFRKLFVVWSTMFNFLDAYGVFFWGFCLALCGGDCSASTERVGFNQAISSVPTHSKHIILPCSNFDGKISILESRFSWFWVGTTKEVEMLVERITTTEIYWNVKWICHLIWCCYDVNNIQVQSQ